MTEISKLARPNILNMSAYSSARSEYKGQAQIWLDANESPIGTYRRYPDPLQLELRSVISKQKGISGDQLFIGNGSDEAIDLLIRIFCKPGSDKILSFTPGYSMYQISAQIQDIEHLSIPIDKPGKINKEKVQALLNDELLKIIFICSPNNPTGELIEENDILWIIKNFQGIVVIDEAYIDFAERQSYTDLIQNHLNLVVLHTYSKAFGMAGLRLGTACANHEIIQLINKIKAPYNINSYTQQQAIELLSKTDFSTIINNIIEERNKLMQALSDIPSIYKVYESQSNFILIECTDANKLYQYLLDTGIVVRNKSNSIKNALRFSIGTPLENQYLITQIQKFYKTN